MQLRQLRVIRKFFWGMCFVAAVFSRNLKILIGAVFLSFPFLSFPFCSVGTTSLGTAAGILQCVEWRKHFYKLMKLKCSVVCPQWVKWHPRGHLILAGSEDFTAWLWNANSGACLNVFSGHSGPVTCGDFTPDGWSDPFFAWTMINSFVVAHSCHLLLEDLMILHLLARFKANTCCGFVQRQALVSVPHCSLSSMCPLYNLATVVARIHIPWQPPIMHIK